jgi:hypothetical protein
MGGGVAVAFARTWHGEPELVSPVVLICPLVRPVIPPCLRPLVRGAAALFPEACLPTWLLDEGEQWADACWSDPVYRDYAKSDWYPQNPKGRAWGGNLRLGTIVALDDLGAWVSGGSDCCGECCILHDPDDAVVPFQHSLDFTVREAVVAVVGGRHDPLANRYSETASHIVRALRHETNQTSMGCGASKAEAADKSAAADKAAGASSAAVEDLKAQQDLIMKARRESSRIRRMFEKQKRK